MATTPSTPSSAMAERTDAVGIIAYVLFILVGGLLVFGFAWGLGPAVEKQGDAACVPLRPEARDEAAPTLVGQTLDGNPVDLADLRGKFVIINFWATYCEPCTREWPELARLADRFAARDDVIVIAVSVDDEVGKIAPYIERMGLSDSKVVIWWDSSGEGKANRAFGSDKIPDTFFVDDDGQLIKAFIDVRDWGRPAAFHCVESLAPS